jgi:hypothetical protein
MRKQYSMGLIADQNTDPTKAYWLNFFGRPVPFIIGPHTIAARNKPVLIYFDMIKLKRGHYAFDLVKTIEDSSRIFGPGIGAEIQGLPGGNYSAAPGQLPVEPSQVET